MALAVAVVFTSMPLVAEVDSAAVLAQIESADLGRKTAVEVEKVALAAGLATVHLDRGWLSPAPERAIEGLTRLEVEPACKAKETSP